MEATLRDIRVVYHVGQLDAAEYKELHGLRSLVHFCACYRIGQGKKTKKKMVRAPCCQKVGLKKGPWSSEEDQILVDYIQRHGHANWRALPRQAGLLRCGKSCRLRWTNYLRPDIKRGNFTKEEEDAIINLHEKLGNKWSAIAAMLPGRTDNEIKNVWHTHLKKRHCPKEVNKTSRKKVRRDAESKLDSGLVGAAKQGEVCSPSSSSSVTTVASACCPAASGEVKEESFEWIDDRFWSEALSIDMDSAELMSFMPPEATPAAEMFDEAFDFSRSGNSFDMEFWLQVFRDAESLDVQGV